MTVKSRAVTVAATATVLNGTDVDDRYQSAQGIATSILVQVPTGGVAVYLGGSDVTTSNGVSVGAGESFSLDLSINESLYGIVATSTQGVRVLQTRV